MTQQQNPHYKALRNAAFELKYLAEKEGANGRVSNYEEIMKHVKEILRAQEGLVCLEKGLLEAIDQAYERKSTG